MIDDPIVREVRKIRKEIEEKCQQDPEAYYQHLKASQEKLRNRLVRRQPRTLAKQKKTG
ncbi:MAG: hypothetical protein U9P00_03295 [Pseudomonadota bacterium]|nr:hypothetical protein [Pseudomonadota bacterium]